MGTETLVHDHAHHKVHVLNASASRILELCDGTRDAQAIAVALSEQTGEALSRVRDDVDAALRTFRELELITYT